MSFHKIIGKLFRHGKLHTVMEFPEESTARKEMEKLIRYPSDVAEISYGEIVRPLTRICKTCLGEGRRHKSEVVRESLCPGCGGTGREETKTQETKEKL